MATIITKFSSTPSSVPLATDLVQGELAVNTADKRLFTEDSGATIIEIGTNPSSITTGAITATGTVTANSSLLSSNATFTGGTVNGMVIGGSTPQAITGTLITANTNFAGALTGNVTGNVTGNLTGNVTGDITGNLTASTGTTTVNNLVVNGTVDFTDTVLTNLAAPSSDTDAATKGYVDTQVSNLVASAPAALDTLNELAAAIGDDANFSTTITTSIATKLPLAGGTMTGAIAMGTNKITGLGTPTAGTDAATKAYADTMLPLAGGTMTGNIVLGSNKATSTATPSTDDDLTRKGYVDSILGSATSAATSAAAAATSASNAATSESNASTSASNAATSATAAAASYDSFDDRYLGAKSSDPTLDNDGDALIAGATYFNTTSNAMKVYSGSAWSDVAPVATSITASQISDVTATAAELNILDGVTATTAELNYVDGVTSNIQTQIDNISVTAGTLTKTFAQDEVATITLSSSITTPVVSVTKEVSQTGVTNNTWDVNSTSENYTRLDSAPATTLDFVASENIDDLSYSSKSFSGTSQSNNFSGLIISTDGTKMYGSDYGSTTIYQYSLSTAGDITTASYDSKSFNHGKASVLGIALKSDGTKLFVLDFDTDALYQYTLSTAYDISTAGSATSFSVSSQAGSALGIYFKPDGTKFYITDNGTDSIYQYSMSTAWDVTTASYDSKSVSVTSQASNTQSVNFTSDGETMYVNDYLSNNIYQYTLTTAWDVSTASYASKSFNFAQVAGNSRSVQLYSSNLYVTDNTNSVVYQYSLSLTLALGTGSFASADVGKTIEANGGKFVLTSTAGAFSQTTAPTSYAQVASGSWEMYAVVYNTTDGDLEISNLNDIYNLSGATLESELSTVDNTPNDLFFKNDGTELYVLGRGSDVIRQKTLSTAWDITTAGSASSYSFAFSDAQGLFIRDDGLKFFIIRNADNLIRRYSMSTAWDITTGSFDSNTFDVGTQDGDPLGVFFKSDGLKFWVVGNTTNTVYQYSMSSAWNLGTASYDSKSLNAGTEASTPTGIFFKSDGTELYLTDDSSNTIYKYGLTTAWDISTASYSNVSFGVTAGVQGIYLRDGGLNFYTVDSSTDKVYQYSMGLGFYSVNSGYHAVHTTTSTDSTYWTDINSMTADEAAGDGSIFYCVSTDDRSTWKIAHNTDGIRSIVRNNSGTWQYNSNGTYASTTWTNATTNTELNALQEAMTGASATVGYDLSNASFDNVTFSFSSQNTAPRGLAFNSNGTKMYQASYTGTIYQYTLSTGYDLSTASYSTSASFTTQSTSVTNFAFSSNGAKLYILSYADKTVYQYSLSTAFDITTASYDSLSFGVNGQETDPYAIAISTDGTKFFVVGTSGDDVNEYTLSTAYNISTASFVDSFSTQPQEYNPYGIYFNSNGTYMFIVGNDDNVNQYTLQTGFDVSTASHTLTFSVAGQEQTPNGIAFNSDGTKMFVSGYANDNVNQYSTSGTSYTNQMNKTQLDAVSDANHFTLANDLDLGIIFNLSSGTTVPSSDGVSINYDANVLNKGAILGTDYDFDAPAATKVRITALAANNLKVRVV